ncbi:Actin cytoskeleton-regulatory complex protein sla1, partial [Smittium mucronatum]
MPYSKVCRAIYQYSAQDSEELTIYEDQLFFIIEETEPGWIKVKARDPTDDNIPIGIVPTSYLEELDVLAHAVCIYDYSYTEDEETSMTENETVDILDDEDPDWVLIKSKAGIGFVPKSYLEILDNNKPEAGNNETIGIIKSTPIVKNPSSQPVIPDPPPPPQSIENQKSIAAPNNKPPHVPKPSIPPPPPP